MPTSTLFLPDISGFTKFVHQTEINHQEHIIAELLELLIDGEELGMTLAEIEGDALFYFKENAVPPPQSLLREIRRMFIRFHSHLRLYDQQRLCQCGACSSATGMTLKFFVHAGNLNFISVKGQRKPHGTDVILAHRIMKNSVPANAYALLTRQVFDAWGIAPEELELPDGMELVKGSDDFGATDVGQVEYYYLDLSGLKRFVNNPPDLKLATKSRRPLHLREHLSLPPIDLFELLTNFRYRMQWNPNIDKLKYDKTEINRTGTKHVCVINQQHIEFETVQSDFGEDKWVYGERAQPPMPLVKSFVNYYILEAEGEGSVMTVEMHPRPWPVFGRLLVPFFKWLMRRQLKVLVHNFKKFAESRARQQQTTDMPQTSFQ